MDLGHKTLNNLTSKDFNLQKTASKILIDSKDTNAFKILCEKSEFLFDFIKEKINTNLFNAVCEKNIFNLFEFMKIYSDDFKDFIVNSLAKYDSKEIKDKMFDLLQNGTYEEKTYSILYYLKIKDSTVLGFAKENINSEFQPLKEVSIKYLAQNKDEEEFNKQIEVLSSDSDIYEKMNSVEFLCIYGDEKGFYPVYNLLKETSFDEIIAANILLIKDFVELIKEDKEDEILTIYSSLIYNFPDNITFNEIQYYNNEGIFDYLVESDNNFSSLILLFLKDKLNSTLFDENYSLDFSGKIKQEAKDFLNILNLITKDYNKTEIVNSSISSKSKQECIMALSLADENNYNTAIEASKQIKDFEIIISILNYLKKIGKLDNSIVDNFKEKAESQTIKLEIESFYS